MKLHSILEARTLAPAIGPVKLWSFKEEGPGRGYGIQEGYNQSHDHYVLSVEGYTDEDCSGCNGHGEDDDGDECEYCGGDGENHFDDFGEQWEVGEVLGTKESVYYFEKIEFRLEGKDLLDYVEDDENIPQHLKDGVYKK